MNTDKTPYDAGRFHRISITRESAPNIEQTQRAFRFLMHLPEMLKQLPDSIEVRRLIKESEAIRNTIP